MSCLLPEREEEVSMRSIVSMSRDNRGRIDLTVAVFRGSKMYHRHFQDIGLDKVYLVATKIDRADIQGRCKISVRAWAPVGWEARFGFERR